MEELNTYVYDLCHKIRNTAFLFGCDLLKIGSSSVKTTTVKQRRKKEIES